MLVTAAVFGMEKLIKVDQQGYVFSNDKFPGKYLQVTDKQGGKKSLRAVRFTEPEKTGVS